MAVVNQYVQNTFIGANGLLLKMDPMTLREQGAGDFTLQALFAIAATDTTGSIYRIFANVPANYVPIWGTIANDAMAGLTSASLGLYSPLLGAVKAIGCFMTNISMAAATTSASPKTAIDAFQSITLANSQQKLWQLAGDTLANPVSSYDICLTTVAQTGNAGNVLVTLKFAAG